MREFPTLRCIGSFFLASQKARKYIVWCVTLLADICSLIESLARKLPQDEVYEFCMTIKAVSKITATQVNRCRPAGKRPWQMKSLRSTSSSSIRDALAVQTMALSDPEPRSQKSIFPTACKQSREPPNFTPIMICTCKNGRKQPTQSKQICVYCEEMRKALSTATPRKITIRTAKAAVDQVDAVSYATVGPEANSRTLDPAQSTLPSVKPRLTMAASIDV